MAVIKKKIAQLLVHILLQSLKTSMSSPRAE